MKDYENIVLERGLAEIESYQKKAAPIDSMKHHLGRRYHSFWDKDGNIFMSGAWSEESRCLYRLEE